MKNSRDRRRHSRLALGVRVILRGPEGALVGTAQNMSYSGILVKADGELPTAQSRYEVILDLPLGTVRAEGEVVRVQPEDQTFAVELVRVDTNGHLLLAMLIATTPPVPVS